jgi:hypothetical protein
MGHSFVLGAVATLRVGCKKMIGTPHFIFSQPATANIDSKSTDGTAGLLLLDGGQAYERLHRPMRHTTQILTQLSVYASGEKR